MPSIAIVDDPDSEHGRLMKRCALLLGPLDVKWVDPHADWPQLLCQIPIVDAVALPFSVVDATASELTVMQAAIRHIIARGIPVFIAGGNRRPNPLAVAGIVVRSDYGIDGVDMPQRVGTSGRTVLAAAAHASNNERQGNS